MVSVWERGDLRPSPFQIERLVSLLHPGFGKAGIWLRARGSFPRLVGTPEGHRTTTRKPSPTAMLEVVRAHRERLTCW